MLRHDRALSLQNIPDFLRLLDGYRIQATCSHLRRRPLPCSIGFPNWKRAYADDVAVVHLRR
ncbi:MAG: hypothetical protein WA706_24320 [Pseudolabrys sp.]